MNKRHREYFEDLGSYILLLGSQKRTLTGELIHNIEINIKHFKENGHHPWFRAGSDGFKMKLAERTANPRSRKVI